MPQGTHSIIFPRAVWRRLTWPLTALVLLAGAVPAAQSQTEEAQPALDLTPFPVVVFINSSGGAEQVTILFAPAQAHDQVAELIARMAQVGAWQARGLQIRDRRYVSWEDLGTHRVMGELQTLVDFAATGVINHQEQRIDLQPFIEALGKYGRLRVALRLDEETRVESPGERDDEQIRIRRHEQPQSVVYDIEIKPVLAAPPPAPTAPLPRRSPWVMVGLGALAAGLAGAAFALWRKGLRWSAAKGSCAAPEDTGAGAGEEGDSGG